MSSKRCLLCRSPSSIVCHGCGNAQYCSDEHQMADWSKHQNNCQYYNVACTEQMGQHLVASRNISAGTVILVDRPIVVGPSSWARLVCLGCHHSIDEYRAHFCSKCQWPLCSEKCENSETHKPECEILAKDSTEGNQGHPSKLWCESPLYDMIIVIRCLLLQSQNPQIWKQLKSMISHSEMREINENDHHHKAIVEFIKRYLVNDEYESKDISNIRGIICSNNMAFINKSGIRLRAIYSTHHLLNHSCIPNLHVIVTEDGNMQVRATVDIKENDMLTVTYTGTVEPFWERHKRTNELFYFSCECRLCKDPTELGTFFSSSRCPVCPDQYLCPNVCDGKLSFVCCKCNETKSVSDIKDSLYEWEARLGMQDMFGQSSPRRVEQELKRVENEFHPTHYIYYKVAKAAIRSLSENDSIRSIDLRYKLWKREIECLNLLDPGLTRRKGVSLLELGHVELLYAKHCMLDSNAYTPYTIRKLQDAIIHLQDGTKCLELEPVTTKEHDAFKFSANREIVEGMKLLNQFSCKEMSSRIPIAKNDRKEALIHPQYLTTLTDQLTS